MTARPVRLWFAAATVTVVVALAGPAAAASAVWNVARVGGPAPAEGVLVAVVDSGVDAAHPAFGGRVVGQQDFVGDGASGDPEGHGTHVAGTLAGGAIDCGDGPAAIGVAAGARILSVRVVDEEGDAYVSDVVDGIRHAADRGAAVINLSLGPEVSLLGHDPDFEGALQYAWDRGSIPVLAAGNGHLLGSITGSGYEDVPAVVVTATTRDDRKASYATTVGDARWGIAAPGGEIGAGPDGTVLSAAPDSRCATAVGTSMAAPHVSGALAVLRGRGLSARQAVDRILTTARPVGSRNTFGAGLLDLAAALDGLGAPPAPSPSPTSAPPPRELAQPVERSGSSETAPVPSTPPTGATPTTITDPPASGTASTPPTTSTSVSERPATSTSAGAETATGVSRIDDAGGDDVARTAAALVAGVAVVAVGTFTGRAALRRRAAQP